MNIIQFSIEKPVTVIVGVLFVVMFGILALLKIPYQLSPNVEEPVISVRTVWPGATPYEIERDIIEEQEKVLKGVPGLYEMESQSSNGNGQITLRFRIGSDVNEALLRVSNKLDEVPSYPENVDKPVINASGAESSPVVWVVLKTLEGNDRDIYTYRTFLENEVRQYFDRIPGVADLMINGGSESQMHVMVNPERLAAYGLTIEQVIQALRSENANVSAGLLGVGRRDYRIRTVAEYRSTEDILNVVVHADGMREVTVGDVATVEFGFAKLEIPTLNKGDKGLTFGVKPEPNTNVLELTDHVEQVVHELNAGLLKENGVYFDWVNDQRPYIRGAIALLKENIAIGGFLAVIVLLLFLRKIAPTVVIFVAIPISVIGTFIFMSALGSTLNVVSLAGIAFAVGMLVDNAIVVLENIDRHKHMGKTAAKAAYDGTAEVWGAVLASSLTNIAVFLPVIFLEEEAGQLFRDIALAVACSMSLSLIVSITVVPMLANRLYGMGRDIGFDEGASTRGILGLIGAGFSKVTMTVLGVILRNRVTQLATIVLLTSSAVGATYALMPKMEYLPQGNRDLIMNIIVPPPGLSFDERMAIGKKLMDFFEPYYEPGYEGYPGIRNTFFSGRDQTIVLGIVSADQMRTPELLPLCRKAIATIPGVFGVSNQASIFSRGIGRGRTIDVNLSGNDIDQLVADAKSMFGMAMQSMPGTQIRPQPSLELAFPESIFVPDRERLRAVGMTAQQLGTGIDVLMDGRDIGDFKQEGDKKIDLVVKVADTQIETPEQLNNALLATPKGGTVPVSSLANMVESAGLTEIRHLERNRTITLQVTPPYEITLQEAMETFTGTIVPEMKSKGMLEGVVVELSGNADKLTDTRKALQWNFVVAALICYLLMSALLSNFVYPLIIMLTVPLASAGGFIGLRLLNVLIVPQQLDILTMLGFIILVGVVVNNPILIVYQALNLVRFEGMDHKAAVMESTRTRLRPIYMSATTSIIGLLPLVLWPGPGSELYRGLGSVMLGGMALSTVFTVFLIPPLLMFCIWMERPAAAIESAAIPVSARPVAEPVGK
ncbi:MAG: acriflavine resistance protein B [Candidatus Hydrogenedentota bacterium]